MKGTGKQSLLGSAALTSAIQQLSQHLAPTLNPADWCHKALRSITTLPLGVFPPGLPDVVRSHALAEAAAEIAAELFSISCLGDLQVRAI